MTTSTFEMTLIELNPDEAALVDEYIEGPYEGP